MTGKPKAVIVIRPDGSEHEYPSGSQAARFERVDQVQISQMCRNGKQIAGLRARFKETSSAVNEVRLEEGVQQERQS